jgi:dephospho-CoA kinase
MDQKNLVEIMDKDIEADKINLKQERIVLHGIEVLLTQRNFILGVVLIEVIAEIQIQHMRTQFGVSFKEVRQSISGSTVNLNH